MDKRPKRRRYRDNPYKLSSIKELNLFYVSFKDAKGIEREVKVTEEVFNIFNDFELEDLSQMNEYDNHIEHISLREEQLCIRVKNHRKLIEDEVIENIAFNRIMAEIKKLPKIQKRRFIKYYFYDMTYKQIAMEEKCTKMAVKFSIDKALEKIVRKFKN